MSVAPPHLTGPLHFEPFPRPMPWGGRALEAMFGKKLPGHGTYGESWEVSDHAVHRSRVAGNGPFAGVTLRQIMESRDYRSDLLGPGRAARAGPFPWLFKLLDARDWLSVQVHPDEKTVGALWPGESAKSEAWFVLSAQPGSRIFAGLCPGVGAEEMRQALAAGNVADCLHSFVPRAGDFLYLPAGTVHAIGGGVLFAEIQETSDATFRLFDWNRLDSAGQPRKLHIEESLAAIHWDQGPLHPISIKDFSLEVKTQAAPERRELVRCPYFDVDFVRADNPFTLPGDGRLKAFFVFAGRVKLDMGQEMLPGEAWLFPAALDEVRLVPSAQVSGMLCTLPK